MAKKAGSKVKELGSMEKSEIRNLIYEVVEIVKARYVPDRKGQVIGETAMYDCLDKTIERAAMKEAGA
jgi:hypothetical protein